MRPHRENAQSNGRYSSARRCVQFPAIAPAKGAHAVDQTKVDGLGITALFRRHLDRHHAEYFGGGGAVYVHAFLERLQQRFIARQMRHDAQLNLRIIGRDNLVPRRRNKRLANAPAFGGADRDVLQIGVAGTQPPRHRHGLVKAGVHAAGSRVEHAAQLVGIGGFQLGQAAMFQQHFGQRKILGQFLQHIFIGGRRAFRRFFWSPAGRAFQKKISPICLGLPRLNGMPASS